MHLIVMAHTLEAQGFFKEYKLVEQSSLMPRLYRGDSFYLLICGEGRQMATHKLSYCLGLLQKQVSEVINLGTAGSLSEHVQTDTIVPIRTCFMEEQQGKMEYKSYTTNQDDTLIDLITANARVLNRKYASKLSCFAQVVDREAWAIGSCCYQAKIKWSCYKYISDRAGAEEEVCQRLKDNFLEYAQALVDFYQENLERNFPRQEVNLTYELPFSLYLTQTQSRQLNTLLQKLVTKWGNIDAVLDRIAYQEILASKDKPKIKSKKIIELLKELLTPFNTKVKSKLESVTAPLSHANIDCKYDPQLENCYLQLTTQIRSEQDLKKLQAALNNFSFKPFKNIFEGDINV